MESCTLLFHPTQNMSHPSVQSVLPVSHLVALSVIRSAVMISQCLYSSDLYFLLVAPKSKSNMASNIWQCIYAEEKPLNEKVLNKEKKNHHMLRLLRSIVRMNILFMKLCKRN